MADAMSARDWGIVAGSIVGVITVLIKLSEQYGLDTKRKKELDFAKARLDLWEQRMNIHEAILSGEELEIEKSRTKEAVDEIWKDANENLDILAPWNGRPRQLIGMPWWKRLFLLYRPVQGVRAFGYVCRVVYWLSWLSVALWFVIWPVSLWITYLQESSADQALSREWLKHSADARKTMGHLLSLFIVLVYDGWQTRSFVIRERPVRKIKDVERI